ncbi:hypothetical protein C5167_000534 [Papaver somniferum]|uniref:26S proteasome non-ATPase regulatory subunit 3 C-terminal domain-containing protein n=1 Tax=Papaver somniferum TaxID=3469 RepID=A0A4Y7KVT6_PAPSO|nr:hypothetical protein C5167_000534 [Papaver somniferum]
MFTRGWSEDQIKSTLRNNPTCMKAPEKKILILDPECLFKEKISSAMVDDNSYFRTEGSHEMTAQYRQHNPRWCIDATLHHANGWMASKEIGDVYSTNEHQSAFNSRIAFCLNMHNEAVRALRFPQNSHKKENEITENRRETHKPEQLAKHIDGEDEDEF